MPVEVCLELVGEKPVLFPFFTGYVSRGLLLHVLGVVDPSLASSLHEAGVVKPYSVTPLRFRSRGKVEGGYVVDPSFPCRVCFRFLRDDVARRVLEYFYERDSVLIYDVVFRVASLSVRSESYRDIWEKYAKPIDSIRLAFLTPTYLSVLGTDYHFMFPDHMKVFPHILGLWNKFSDHKKFSEDEVQEYRGWLLRNVGVSMYKLKTRIAYMRDKKATGFIGWANYEIKNQDEWSKVTSMLAKYAEYSNIGGNRTGGFGVTKHITKNEKS